MLWDLIQDIEPWDLGVIQKDVAPETVDAMKRTISGMLGLLPSDRIRVVVEALWNPFFKLLLPSIMTGSITIAAMPGQLPDMEMLAQFGCGAVLLSLGAAFPYGVLSMGMVFMAENVK
ncbi:hypothetical protein SETIT_2G332700v2 [Setaria italica]|uniref:Uncharacterized protein n=2 Tax=Setaria italica TaxID=4555 RepID=A0A368Q5X9_SETIT|nr:hypothetical protein SETIT_2G332700v2 [Setaria italica]RCV13263.1 hypothetical protein SETIT_2G332700v2 [Setaria italica]